MTDIGKIIGPFVFACLVDLGIHTRPAPILQQLFGGMFFLIQDQHTRHKPGGACRHQLSPKARHQPASHAHMIWVMVGQNNAADRLTLQRSCQHAFPQLNRALGMHARIHD